MYLNYKNIGLNSYGNIESPELILKTLDEKTIGVLTNTFDLKFNIKFAELSQMTFTISAYNNGVKTPFYDKLTGYKIIYTKNYGVYMTRKPKVTGDGVSETKEITAYSLESIFEHKRLFLEGGEDGQQNVWNLFNRVDPTDENTVVGRILELMPGWSIGEVSASLTGRYRAMDSFNDYLLTFVYDKAPETFRCVFVFDPYEKTMSVYDIDETRTKLPIYLDYDNLITEIEVEEMDDEMVTSLSPYGADNLNIIAVNPTGTNKLYDLSFFIDNGDIEPELAEKWRGWQASVEANTEYYKGLIALQSSYTAQILTKQAKRTDLLNELDGLKAEQNVAIKNNDDNDSRSLADIKDDIDEKNSEVESIDAEISDLTDLKTECTDRITDITSELKLESYFTNEELLSLSPYFIEQELVDDTFVASDISSNPMGASSAVKSGTHFNISGADISMINTADDISEIYSINGGSFELGNDDDIIQGNIIRATLEKRNDNYFVLSIYAGDITKDTDKYPSGTITLSGSLNNFTSDVVEIIKNGLTLNEGTTITFNCADDASLYITTSINEYQKYSVQQELYDFALKTLTEAANPVYEFSVSSGNFLFAKEFTPFKNNLELGSALYLRLNENTVITPIVIELEFDFENPDDFSLIFSNRFKRHDNVNTLKNMIETSYSSSRSFDASKYIYNQSATQASKVSEFMRSSLDAAVNNIIGASDQSVLIDGAGIQLRDPNGNTELRLVNNMIAMTDNGWQTAKLALGEFTVGNSSYFGINAEVIGGKLIVGNNLVIENETDNGVMQFKVDSTGAWLNNSTMVIQGNGTGGILLDPKYGIIAGSSDGAGKNFFTIDGTTVTPSFINSDGEIEFDDNNMPKNSNFYLDKDSGNAYFRGNVYATDGEFKGVVQASTFKDQNGKSMLTADYKFDADYLSLKGLEVKKGNITTFEVDSSGKVRINGTVTMDEDSSINWSCVKDKPTIPTLPTYLESTYINSVSMLSPTIVGGRFYATGQGSDKGAAYYIRNGGTYNTSTGEFADGTPVGYISYDTKGSGESDKENIIEAENRVFFKTENDTALKIESATNMSLEAKRHTDANGEWQQGTIYLNSNVSFMSGKEIDFAGANVKGLVAKFG